MQITYLLKKPLKIILLNLIVLALVLLLLELIFRLKDLGFQGLFKTNNLIIQRDPSKHPIEFDEQLGWRLKIGNFNKENRFGVELWNILYPYVRKTNREDVCPVNFLFIGDSFTHGDEVSDNESLPYYFEKISGKNVINAGVPAFGIDQMYLNTLRLLDFCKPKTVVFSIIYSDVLRTEQKIKNGIQKPYFLLENNQLVLHQLSKQKLESSNLFLKKIVVRSALLISFFKRFYPGYIEHTYFDFSSQQKAHNDGILISARLINKLQIQLSEKNIKLLLVPLETHHCLSNNSKYLTWINLLREHLSTEVEIINAFETFHKNCKINPKKYSKFFTKGRRGGHYSASGNRHAAELIFNTIFPNHSNEQL